MEYPKSRQTVENILVGLRRDILILSIKQYMLTDNARHLINTLDKHLPSMVDYVRRIFVEGSIDLTQAIGFYDYLMEISLEALGHSKLPEILENDESDLVELVKNQFIQIIRVVDEEINRING